MLRNKLDVHKKIITSLRSELKAKEQQIKKQRCQMKSSRAKKPLKNIENVMRKAEKKVGKKAALPQKLITQTLNAPN